MQILLEDAYNYWEDSFDEVVEDIQEYTNCKFKKDRKEDFYDSLSEGKDQ